MKHDHGRRVVITGIGPLTASGIGADGLWEGLKRERSPIREVSRFDASLFNSRIAAEIDDASSMNGTVPGGR